MSNTYEDSDQEISELDIQSRTWKKLEDNMKSVGFREGAAKGKYLSLQEGFNLGYSDGFKMGEYIGICKGIMSSESELDLAEDKKSNIDGGTLNITLNEACVLCSQEKKSNAAFPKTITFGNIEDLISAQQSHNNEVRKTLESQIKRI